MYIHNLSEQNSILNTFLLEIRDLNIQQDPMRFRRNIERIGEVLSYEMSKALSYKPAYVKTPLGIHNTSVCNDAIVICSVLRAGLPLHIGVLNYFDRSENAFISAYRHHNDGGKDFDIVVEYVASPSLENKTLVLVDPMLATGKSLVLTYEALITSGVPKEVHLMSVIGADDGVNHIADKFPENTHLWIGAIDKELNDKGYIVPGLGDAGDLAYGNKL